MRPWRRAGRAAGLVLVVVAAVVLTAQVQVGNGRSGTRSCGSAWDVVAGRVGWPQWWSADLQERDPGRSLLRTMDCPGTLNRHVVASAALALGAVVVASAGEIVDRRRRIGRRPPVPDAPGRLKMFGVGLTALGGVLTAGGLAGISLLVANPDSGLFVYVRRPVVVLAGLLLLLPAILLGALGRAVVLMVDHQRGGEAEHEGT